MLGKLKTVNEKGFGFIQGDNGTEYFFHRSGFNGHWDDLREDFNRKIRQEEFRVEFEFEGDNPKGPRACNVRRTDYPNQS